MIISVGVPLSDAARSRRELLLLWTDGREQVEHGDTYILRRYLQVEMLIQRKVLTPAHMRIQIGSILRHKVPHQARAR
jgi:hypothetical protein